MMTKLLWLAATGIAVACLVVLSAILAYQTAGPTLAQGAITMGIDTDTTGNTASTLGTIETCTRVDVGSPAFDNVSDYNIDVYVAGDTQAPLAYDAWVTYDQTKVHIANPGFDDLIKMPAAISFSDTRPDSDGQINTGAIYFDGPGTAGNGTLVRLGLDIGASGIVTFGWAKGAYTSGAGAHAVTTVIGKLAINQDCPVPNRAPTCNDLTITTAEDTAAAATLDCTDLDLNPLTYTIVTPPAHGALSGTAPNLTYTPAANYHGPDSFTYKANDGELDSNTATANITVTSVNDAPVCNNLNVNTPQDTAVGVTLVCNDVDSDPLTYSIVTPPAHGTLSGVAPNLTYTPDAGYSGPDSFTYKANDGTVDSNTATVSITVSHVNHAPTCNNLTLTTAEDTPVAATLNCTDPDPDTLTYSIVTPPAHGTLSGTAPNLTYTPAANYNGPDSFTYRANDGTVNSNTATASITVTPVNDAPTCNNLTINAAVNTAVAVTLSCTDADGDTLTYTVVTPPAQGALSGTAPNLTYTPATGYLGADSFTYKANDGTVDSNTATVSITESEAVTVTTTATATATATATTTSTVTVTVTATPTPATTLSADAPAGSSEISVTDASGLAVGDTIQIGTGDSAETCTITAISDSTLTLDCTLEFDHAAGEAVAKVELTPTPTPVGELCSPVIPGTYNGLIRLNGVPAADGSAVTATIDGAKWGDVLVSGGRYVMDIPESLPASPPCFEAGTITFTLSGGVCQPSPQWASGLHDLDLSCAPAPSPTPPTTATPPVGPSPTGTPKATPAVPPPTGWSQSPGAGGWPWVTTSAAAGLSLLLLAGAAFTWVVVKRRS